MISVSEWLESIKKKLKNEIEGYESKNYRFNRPINKKNPMSDISARYRYEENLILLKVMDKNSKAFMDIWLSEDFPSKYRNWSNVRQMACCMASGGRTMILKDLTEEELWIARANANEMVNKHIQSYKERVL